MPRTVKKNSFELFINILEKIINKNNINNFSFDSNQTYHLITICDYFKYSPLLIVLINNYIYPSLDKNTCLTIIKDYIKKLYDPFTRMFFTDLIANAIKIAADNIFYLINNKYQELMAIGNDPLEEIIENYLSSVMFNNNIDNSLVIRLMIKIRKLNDVFELLENERKKAIHLFGKQYSENEINNSTNKSNIEPSIIWNIKCDNPQTGFYKESEEFLYENLSLVLISYYDSDYDVYSIAVKIKDVKQDSEINSNVSINNNNNNSSILNINNNNNNNNINNAIPSYIVSLLSICEIKEINLKTKINFNCIFTNLKAKVLMFKINDFSRKFKCFNAIEYQLLIYFNISYNFSLILTHICKLFYEYYSIQSIGTLTKNVFNIILKYEHLNIRNDDEILEAVKNWGIYIILFYIK